jgi:hypothetical protein
MDFRTEYPDYEAIQGHIRRAHAERSLAIAQMIANAIEAIVRGTRRFAADLGNGLQADWEKRAIEADSFLKRYVPRY